MLQKLRKNRKGFTLIELIVVIAILGILAAILIPQFSGFQEKAKSSQALVNAKQVATAGDGLLAEGRTDLTSATATTTDDLTAAVIKQVAGDDIAVAEITNLGITGGHVTFTYTKVIDTKTYVAIRDAAGKIAVTWS